ncbi:MAG: polysaccharide deacetylase family protein [Nitrospiraceae bacterium]
MGAVQALTQAKTLARRWAAELYARSPGFLRQLRGTVTILMYHRVATEAELSSQFIQPAMYVTAETFDRQVRFLREHFDVLSMHELLSMWREKIWNPDRRYCVITFDDGWLDNYMHAFPVLRRYDVPATIFLPTGVIGTDQWFWPEQVGWLTRQFALLSPKRKVEALASLREGGRRFNAVVDTMAAEQSDHLIERCKAVSHEGIGEFVSRLAEAMGTRLPEGRLVMNWEEVGEMSAAKISFGSHSVNHKILTTVSAAELHEEVHGSFETLRERSLNLVPVFCYPNGNYSPTVMQCVEAAGYCAATSTEPGWEVPDTSRMFRLKRIGIHNDLTSSESLFAFHLAGYNTRAHN